MSYEVAWLQSVEDRLALLWEQASDREAVIRAAAQIDVRLHRHGAAAGEELAEALFALNEGPLRALFTVEGRSVEVVALKRISAG